MRNGKRKGDAFENEIARALSVWLVQPPCKNGSWEHAPVSALPFRRRFTAGIPLEGHWDNKGDILHKPGILFPFAVECKKVEGWELDGIFGCDKWEPWEWWGQCVEQAATMRLFPLLIFTRNRRSVYTLVTEGTHQWLGLLPANGPLLRIESPQHGNLVLTVLENLLLVPRERVTAKAKTLRSQRR